MAVVNDIDQLPLLSTDTILDLLGERYSDDDIYTWACTTLVAINPYKELEKLYCQSTLQGLSDDYNHADTPHIYSIAENAINIIKQSYIKKCDASIIVSGESGAGKTENTKHLLRYLTVVRSQQSLCVRRQKAEQIEKHILTFSPVLESLGNACTSCNDNSSRFGKYIVLQYDENQVTVGAHIQTYLLEKTRVVNRSAGNYNFHIFYQFLDGLSDDERVKYLVDGVSSYNYACESPQDGRKTHTWEDTLESWRNVGFSDTDKDDICTVLGAILCLGNIEICQGVSDEPLSINKASSNLVDKVSSLLGMERQSLDQALLYRRISASHSRRRSVFHKPCTYSESISRRYCVAKLLHDRLFLWFVDKINSKIRCDQYSSFIGLLDIYGFESFSENSLEQLCINYANERLQQYFVQYYLRDLQAEYADENVPWQHVDMTSDNKSCVQLMSANPSIFSFLNEECQLNRLVAEDKISQKLYTSLSTHPNLMCTQKDVMKKTFTVKHYAHPVLYHTDNMVDKNKDAIPEDIVCLLEGSKKSFISALVDGCQPVQKGKQRKTTVISKFEHSLDELLILLRSTECQYVRCIKPNKSATAAVFDREYVDKQLKACGVMETVKIRSQAHAVRMTYEDFLAQYSVLHSRQSRLKLIDKENDQSVVSTPLTPRQRRRTLLPSAEINQSPCAVLSDAKSQHKQTTPVKSRAKKCVMSLLRHLLHSPVTKSVNFGTTKLFIKSQLTLDDLENRKQKKLSSSAFTIQCAWRRYTSLKYKQKQNQAACVITRAIRQHRDRLMRLRAERQKLAEQRLSHHPDRFSNVTLRRSRASVKEYRGDDGNDDISVCPTIALRSSETLLSSSATVIKNIACREYLHKRNRIVSVRYISDSRVMFHVRTSSMLKYSHVTSQTHTYLNRSLLDCLEDTDRNIRLSSVRNSSRPYLPPS